MSNPSSDGDQIAGPWSLNFPHASPARPIVNLGPVSGEMCQVTAGLTPFYVSFETGSEPASNQSRFSEVFDLCPCKLANLSPEAVLAPHLPRPLQSDLE